MTITRQPSESAVGVSIRHQAARRWLPVAGPGVVMLILGLTAPARPVLSWDEVATADVAHRSVGEIWRLAHHIDGVFGPYYLLMHLWTRIFGDSVLSLRLPSILAMAAAAALTGELGRRLAGPRAGTIAGLLLCAIPTISRYAAEARPYAIACLLSSVALLALYRALDAPGPRRWAAYAAALTGLGLFSLVALSAVAGHLALVLIRSRDRLTPWCAAAGATLVPMSPLIWWGVHQRAEQLHWVTPITLTAVRTFPAGLTGSPQVAWLLWGLLALAVIRPSRGILELTVLGLVPPLVVAGAAVAGTSFWVPRYLLFVLIPVAVAAGAGLARYRLAGLVAVAVFAAVAVPGQVAVRGPTVKNGSDYRTLATTIRGQQQSGDDLVLGTDRTMRAGLSYYLRHDPGGPRDVLVQRSAAQTATLKAAEYPDPAARLADAARIWLVVYGRSADPTGRRHDLRKLLHDRYRRAGLWTVKNATMALYVRTPSR
ncbi:mannosyltransferase [Actinoplanes ianthinogenes]|uniref:Mannosyltransferase n=1 Tax=Actinoplanes ianthinogenes TaxID=122358 RepID=A0ABN6CR56_9ACTN|nr:glycosyltransferase family 39 protein [Actinoplanes ianthinogenes]BCJ47632.1 mannosyltransferase [Actinoplanes ianthinogenes]GGR03060.1 mannosyltransferase [Actinoplanes ianthinogenes]